MRIPPLLFPRQDCAAGLYYVCATPPFRGCCSVDPCGTGCPDGNGSGSSISAAVSSATPAPATSTTRSSATSRATSATSNISGGVQSTGNSSPKTTGSTVSEPSQIASNLPTNAPSTSSKSSTPTGLIAGMVVLAVVILVLIAILFFYRRRRTTNKESTESSKRTSSFFSRMSLTSPLIAGKGGFSSPRSPESAMKSPPPVYTDDKDTPVLDSNPIHELPITTERNPTELPASTPVRGTRFDPAHPHAMSFAEAGAERDEVGALAPNLATRGRTARKPVATERESWASGVTAASTEAVVGVDGLGIRSQ